MSKIVIGFLSILLLLATAFGQTVTTIYDVQYTTDGSGDSPFKDQQVTVTGVISGESGAFGSNYFIQDSSGAWNGIMVYDKNHTAVYGDSIRITATVAEYYGMTELKDVTEYVVLDSGKTVEPAVVTTGEIGTGGSMAEAYEGVLVRVLNANITNADLGYGEWEIDDGSGPCVVDDKAEYYFNPSDYSAVKSITGVMNYSYSARKLLPRLAWDIIEDSPYTRIQRIQQVRKSDLVKALQDEESDVSYALGDTVSVKGVVTMPTGLSYAGSGIKFIVSEPDGGPWSGILSYNEDSTAYPILYEGDLIDMTGYIYEYSTGPSNMTEFFINSPINIIDVGQPLPAPNKVKTGDLRIPETAEQWGNVFVYVQDADVVNYGTQYELFGLDDGSGDVLVDDDSDSLATYYDSNPLPPIGTPADSVRGWVYHHFGSYADSTAYKLEPLYIGDVNWGAGPPVVSEVMRDIDIPTSSDDVTVSAKVETKGTMSEVALYYEILSGGVSGGMNKVIMNTEGSDIYSGQIPATAENNFVNYFIVATDVSDQVSMMPADTSVQNYCYPVTDGTLSIADIQYTPWSIADSPFEGVSVEVTGVLTTDTTANNRYDAYSIQDAESPWSGIFASGINANLFIGDEVTVFGTVTDYNAAWHFKWDNNTTILVDSMKINSTGNTVNPLTVETGTIANDTSTVEAYEGVLVKIQNATLTSLNSYDVSFDDGSGECLVDGDFMVSADQNENELFYINDTDGYLVAFGDTVHVGEKVSMIQGVLVYSFGSYKIEVRNQDDFGTLVGIDENFKPTPKAYSLHQNYPNPFNPETKIYFDIPADQKVKILVYNVLGQKVRTLVNEEFRAGSHILNWDGRNDVGQRLPSGIYIYRIKAGNFIAAKKMMMVK